ncbi:hypothetical protein NDA10_005344 [Ustilago hordei]|uniref:Uncharacterized protein n=1 Tax=Ustilago hordei TaxID=120017 RepID=I2FWV6_USTHO|nr:uncharacterized protein UHO2_04222 [Ustilago hordei]KAJ1037137.1 hypothetical protein NDA10_005344 [Ustilago hordei]CCF51399.1 uncharacterized protein UHOR_05353 [Ustilago hordei]SYW79579.1 uncharacterized protein UHO2_04222 [Ustilago hordei]
MASASTSRSGMDGQKVSGKPSKLLARSKTLYRSPHGDSGSGAGFWLANSPSPNMASFADSAVSSSKETDSVVRSKDSQGASTSYQQAGQQKKRIYHFSAELARASHGGCAMTLGGSMDYEPTYTAAEGCKGSMDDGDVDLDLSFDYVSRLDGSLSLDPRESSQAELEPRLTSHFSPDHTPESVEAPSSHNAAKAAIETRSTSSNSLSSWTGFSTSPSPNSKALRSMRANADWEKRRKAPPAPLNLTAGAEAKRQRGLAMERAQKHAQERKLPLMGTMVSGPSAELGPASGELIGKSVFSPVTPATGTAASLPAAQEPLPLTPLSATRRGAAIHRLPRHNPSASHDGTPDSAWIRRAASTSAATAKQQSLDTLRRTPSSAAHSCHQASAVQQRRRARSHSNRSFRTWASPASLGPPPLPPPNKPLPCPAPSPSSKEHSLPSTSAYHTAKNSNSTITKSAGTRPLVSSVDSSQAARSLRCRTAQKRSSSDSFRTAISDAITVEASSSSSSSSSSIRWREQLSNAPPLPPLQRYEALFPAQNDCQAAHPSAPLDGPLTIESSNLLAIPPTTTASTLTFLPITSSSLVGFSATTWSMSDQSTPSTHHTPLTPFTPMFDLMPGTATSAKTQFTAATRPSICSEPPQAHQNQGKSGAQAEPRGGRNTEQCILTQRQRKALLQSEERFFHAAQTLARLSIRADERHNAVHPTISLPATQEEATSETRSRQDSRSTDATDDDQHPRARQTLVISTVSTPDESVDPFAFVARKPTLIPDGSSSIGLDVGAAMHNAVQCSQEAGPKPTTCNQSATTGPWPQSPLLLNLNLPNEAGVKATAEPVVSPALTTIIHSNYATPQIDAHHADEGSSAEAPASQHLSALQGLGLEFDSPDPNAGPASTQGGVKGFAPITTDLLRQASRCMTRFPQHSASPHLSIQMSPGDNDKLNRSRSKYKEALLTRASRQEDLHSQDPHKHGLGFDLVNGPSPLLPNDCRSPRTASGKVLGSSAPSGLNAIVQGSPADVAVHRAQVNTNTQALLHSQSIASSISAFVYNATPAPTADAEQPLPLSPNKPKTGSIGWRRSTTARRSQALALGMRSDKQHTNQDSADAKFVNIDLDHGGLQTEVEIEKKGGEAAKAGQWVSKLWSAMASPRKTSFGVGASTGDRSVDLELADSSGDQSGEKVEGSTSGKGAKGERTASRASFRPLSLVEKRQSSARYHLDAATRQRFRSPTPGEQDEVAEKDARAVALRLLAGSPRLPPPAEEQADGRADLSSEKREKEPIDALKKLRRMSAVERQKKRNSGIAYITSTTAEVESPRLAYVCNSTDDAAQHQVDPAVRHGGLSRAGSMNNKRMSMTMFGGKERFSTSPMPLSTDTTAAAVATAVGAERAWLDAMRSPRMADSPSGFTPTMMFEPQDWGVNPPQQRQDSNHIPLMLSGSATAAHRQAPPPVSANEHGLTVSGLVRARDQMRRLAGQGMAFKSEEFAQAGAGETFHTSMPDAPDSWSYPQHPHHHQQYYAKDDSYHEQEYEQAQYHITALGDFGISPGKKEVHLHRRTRTARFALDEQHHHYDDNEEDHPAVSIFTRSQHRHRASGSFSLRYGSHDQHPAPRLISNRSRSKRRASTHHAAAANHGLFTSPGALLDSNTPSKNMFWAGFLGMPWLWMIGGWYLTPDGQLRHPSADDPRVRNKFDVWQHVPSMQQQQGSASSSPNPGSSSTTFGGGASYEQFWSQGESGLGLSGLPSMSYAASSTSTANSAKNTNSDPNRPPPTKVRKSKTRSLGSLLDTNPQISFYQSPVRMLQEPQPNFSGVWHGAAGMVPVPEVEEPRRSRIFAGFPDEGEQHSSAGTSTDGSTAVAPTEHIKPEVGYRVAMATKPAMAMPWKDLERYVLLNRQQQQQQQQQQQHQHQQKKPASAADVFAAQRQRMKTRAEDAEEEEMGAQKGVGLTSYDAVRWLSSQPPPAAPPFTDKESVNTNSHAMEGAATQSNPAGTGSLMFTGAAAALAATTSSFTISGGGLGSLLIALFNPSLLAATTAAPPSQAADRGEVTILSTYNHLFLRAIFRIVFRVIVLIRIARFRNSATPISALVFNELLR